MILNTVLKLLIAFHESEPKYLFKGLNLESQIEYPSISHDPNTALQRLNYRLWIPLKIRVRIWFSNYLHTSEYYWPLALKGLINLIFCIISIIFTWLPVSFNLSKLTSISEYRLYYFSCGQFVQLCPVQWSECSKVHIY